MKELQHFLLTRFNILLWRQDKEGHKVRNIQWLEHRFSLFEKFCLPSIKCQTCQDFEWIVLFDNTTPERFKDKISSYQSECPQLIPVFVEPENGRYFAELFKIEMGKRLCAERVVSTYLDNDDALNLKFVEDLQNRVCSLNDGAFIFYDEGYQYYTKDKYMMRISYPRNHFVSVVEEGNPTVVKGIFGYGSHYYINKIEGVKIEHVKGVEMWCEVVHDKNVMNDAKFLNSKMVRDKDLFRRDFAIDETVKAGFGLYVFDFLPRFGRSLVKRVKSHFNRMEA